MSSHTIEPCWQAVTPALASEIIALWQGEAAIVDSAEAARRVAESVCVARDGAGRLVAVATAQRRAIPFLGQPMYYLRAFLARPVRRGLLAHRLLRACQDALAADAASASPASDAIGLFLELENPVFAREGDRAVWRRSGMIYAGRTPRGLQRRIWYFPGARLARG